MGTLPRFGVLEISAFLNSSYVKNMECNKWKTNPPHPHKHAPNAVFCPRAKKSCKNKPTQKRAQVQKFSGNIRCSAVKKMPIRTHLLARLYLFEPKI